MTGNIFVIKNKHTFLLVLAIFMLLLLTGCQKSTSGLIKDLGSSDVKKVEEAKENLQAKGNEVVPELIESLESSKADVQRVNIIRVLGKLKSTDAVKPVLVYAAANSNNKEYFDAARGSIIEIGPNAAKVLIDNCRNSPNPCAEELLADIFENYTEEYVSLFLEPDSTISKTAMHALLKADTGKSLEALNDICQGSSISLKRQAAVLLGEFKDLKAINILASMVNEEDRYLRKDIITSLSAFQCPEAIAALSKMTGEKDPELRRALIDVFGAYPKEDAAFNALVAMTNPNNPDEYQVLCQYIDNALYAVPQSEISKLLNISGYKNASRSSRRLGKTIIIDRLRNRIPIELFPMLPPENRVSLNRIEEAETLIILETGDYAVGTYTNGSTASIKTCTVKVIDLKSKTILGSKKFEGGEPPFTITYYSNEIPPKKVFGSDPSSNEMLNFILKFK